MESPQVEKENPSRRSPSFLEPKRVLSKEDYKKFRELRKEKRRSELLSKIKSLQKQVAYIRYKKSISGRIGQATSKGLRAVSHRGGVTRILYRKQIINPQQKQRLLRLRQMQIEKNQQQKYFDSVFSCGEQSSQEVEEQINSPMGYARQGDVAAQMLDNQSFSIASLNTASPMMQVTRDVHTFSNFIDLKPNIDIDAQVNFFSNLLF